MIASLAVFRRCLHADKAERCQAEVMFTTLTKTLTKILVSDPIFKSGTRLRQAENRSLVTQIDKMDVWILSTRGDENVLKRAKE